MVLDFYFMNIETFVGINIIFTLGNANEMYCGDFCKYIPLLLDNQFKLQLIKHIDPNLGVIKELGWVS